MSTNNNNDTGRDNHHHSPSHIAMTGHDFSPEDLQDLLGGVLGDPHPGDSSADLHSLGGAHSDLGDDKAVARTERKRSREKQRRCDVNRQFSELTAVLRRIEAEAEELRAPTLYSPNNRADLIARTASLLNQLHESNKRRKQEITQLQEELQQTKKAGEETAAKLKESMMTPQNMGGNKMLMMVPMMIGGDGGATPANMGAFGGGQGMSFMMPPPPEQQSRTSVASYAQSLAPSSDQATAAGAMQGHPWGMMPPWMMQHMVMPPSFMGGAASTVTTTSPNGANVGGDQKAASDSSAPVGSNLAHCA